MKRSLVLHIPSVDEVFRNVNELLASMETMIAVAEDEGRAAGHHVHRERFAPATRKCKCEQYLPLGEACGAHPGCGTTVEA